MLTNAEIAFWRNFNPWSADTQVEQDFLLSKIICEIYNNEFLSDELVLRGGTAYHKLFLQKPYRYSEDLDFVRTSAGGIGDIMHALTKLGNAMGFKVNTAMVKFPKVFYRYEKIDGTPGKIKLEIDTYERSPMLEFDYKDFKVEHPIYSNETKVLTFQPTELVATKLRALYQRSKGRDLYDLWLALTELKLEPEKIIECFSIYKPNDVNSSKMIRNLNDKLKDIQFCKDVYPMLHPDSPKYDPQEAGLLVTEKLLNRLD